ncbi:ATP-dependent nuclease [Paenibacillus wenxiniae]|uniref:ATP-dependent endonuclease n=1 Tax=Paenibacillus wenxiniae TaxID=1636843 RepID=A0ABW4RN96_9BACL
MKLKHIKISNFRSYGPEEVTIDFETLTTFIGANSSGKSSALVALIKMFGDTNAERILEKTDFHVPMDEVLEESSTRELSLEAEFIFPEIENEEDEELSYAIPLCFEQLAVYAPESPPCLRIKLDATWEQGNTPDGVIESMMYYVSASENEDSKIRVSSSELSQVKVIYVPAIRNPTQLLKNATGTLLWRVLKGINWSNDTRENIKTKLAETEQDLFREAGLEKVRTSLKTQWKQYHQDRRYTEASIRFNSTDLDQLIKKFEVDFMPSPTQKPYSIDSLGDGLRSLFYLSLIDTFLDIEQQALKDSETVDEDSSSFNLLIPAITIVAIEEPENHVSPHLLGNIINNLKRISEKVNSQVILTSHTPAIIKRISPESIRYFSISNQTISTQIKQIILPTKKGSPENEEAYKYVKEAIQAYPEIYFSKLVILGEGDSEEVILSKAMELHSNTYLDDIAVSIVPLGGRYVNHFWRLLRQLEIPYVTLLDFDKERNGGGWGRIKYAIQQLIRVGEDRSKLLSIEEGILTDKEFEEMHTWREDCKSNQDAWIKFLEDYDVFFSYPLDLDFMMLEKFPDAYKATLQDNEGPQISVDNNGQKTTMKIVTVEGNGSALPEYDDRVELAVKHSLKEKSGTGETYSDEQKKLMIWYDYFFLQRGKPVTHRLAMLKIEEDQFKEDLPDILKSVLRRAMEKLNYNIEENNNEKDTNN